MVKKIYVVFVAIILATVLTLGCTDESTTPDNGDNGDVIPPDNGDNGNTTEPDDGNTTDPDDGNVTEMGDLTITSSAFEEGEDIPLKYSCDHSDGIGISPPLSFENVSEDAETLVLIVDDPDAPGATWDHWIVFNIPADVTGFEEDAVIPYYIGENSWDEIAYGGPCPPYGSTHRYYFKLYALNTTLDLTDGATKTQVEDAMEGYILAEASLMGRFTA